mgnify:CR=1 FL=1
MDKYQQKWTALQNNLFRFLCLKVGQSINLRGIARELKVSPTAVSKAMEKLEKEKLIKKEKSKTMNLILIEFNRDNPKAIENKRVENLKIIYESEVLDYLHNEFLGCSIILFGSYSLGEDTIKSDIDIAIIGANKKNIDLTKYDKFLERKISINYYKSWNEIHKHLKENILRGIVIYGGVEL